MHNAEIRIVRDDAGERCVVTHADEVIWLAEELWPEITDPTRQRIPGDAEINGELLTFGTDGEGLGRLTFRRTGYAWDNGWRFIVCERVKP